MRLQIKIKSLKMLRSSRKSSKKLSENTNDQSVDWSVVSVLAVLALQTNHKSLAIKTNHIAKISVSLFKKTVHISKRSFVRDDAGGRVQDVGKSIGCIQRSAS